MVFKITSFNVEWMNDFFYPDETRFKESHKRGGYTGPSINDIHTLSQKIGNTILQIDPDILGIVEGPKLENQMKKFIQKYLNDEYEVIASPSKRNQRPYILYKKSLGIEFRTLNEGPLYEKMINRWEFQQWGTYCECVAKWHEFYRLPLVVEFKFDDRLFTIILLHIKSKHTGINPSDWKRYVDEAILARQKITTEIKKVRDYLDDVLFETAFSNKGPSIIVMGDLNDGPGRDIFEKKYMLQNLVDVIQGTLLNPELTIYHALETFQSGAFTVIFDDPIDNEKKPELLDHILLSSAMMDGRADILFKKFSGKVEHEAWKNNLGSDPDNIRDDRSSDHRPISCEIE